MKRSIFNFLLICGILISNSAFAYESADAEKMCAEVYPSDVSECEAFVQNNKFEKIPVELCNFRISRGEMFTCYKAIANKTYKYDVILTCASTHHYGIPGCLEQTGSLITD
jgi:hypothetical protein